MARVRGRGARPCRSPRSCLRAWNANPGRWSAADGRAALAAAEESGLSLASFAAQEGLVAQRLYWWRRRPAETELVRAPTFIELKAGSAPQLIEVVLRSGRVLRLPESIDVATMQRLVDALE